MNNKDVINGCDFMFNGARLKFGSGRMWISTANMGNVEYNGAFLVPLDRMADNISNFKDHNNLQSELAKYKYAEDEQISDDEIRKKRLGVMERIGELIVRKGPYVCSNCYTIVTEWENINSGLYSNLYCSQC